MLFGPLSFPFSSMSQEPRNLIAVFGPSFIKALSPATLPRMELKNVSAGWSVPQLTNYGKIH